MNIVTMDQRTNEWFAAKCGKFGASGLDKLMATLKSGAPAASRKDVIRDKVLERLTGSATRRYVSPAMQDGIDYEDEARAAYERHAKVFVEQVGWVADRELPFFGCSPDGLVDERGLCEIKIPVLHRHLDALLGSSILVEDYNLQCQAQMDVCERDWNDLISYRPELPERLRLWVYRIHRDEEVIASIRAAVTAANAEVEEIIARLSTAPPEGQESGSVGEAA